MKLYVVGQSKEYRGGSSWELQGVFDTELLARSACRSEDYFIMPVNKNESFPDETMECTDSDCYYPLLKEAGL